MKFKLPVRSLTNLGYPSYFSDPDMFPDRNSARSFTTSAESSQIAQYIAAKSCAAKTHKRKTVIFLSAGSERNTRYGATIPNAVNITKYQSLPCLLANQSITIYFLYEITFSYTVIPTSISLPSILSSQ
jgi:hypothetical protein